MDDHRLIPIIATDKDGNFLGMKIVKAFGLKPPPLAAMAQMAILGKDTLSKLQ